MKLGQLIKLSEKIFMVKYAETVRQKLILGFYLILVNNLKYGQWIEETL